jgi:hypothetical protein
MLKKITLASVLSALTISTAHASAFYAGPSLGLINHTSPNGSYRGIQPTLHVGYMDMVSTCTYIAFEGFASPGNAELSDDTPAGNSLKSTYSMGASFIPGYLITDNVIGYLRLGIIDTNFSSGSSKAGGQAGLGLQTALTDEWRLYMEYDYSKYSSNKSLGTVKTDQFVLGVNYLFLY